jgi:TnpA family transposase
VLQEYGQLNRTIFILRYLEDEAYQRRIGLQLNKGEALHALRNFLFLANQGRIRRGVLEDQTNQAQCLNLVTDAVVVYRFKHINPYGRYHFDPELAKSID